ncbi:hypothetical protein Tco_0491936 [Tanacetum coccineum]
MPRATVGDTSLTRSYIPKVSQTPSISPSIAGFYKPIEDRCIHEGGFIDQLYCTSNHIDRCFSNIRLNCLYEITVFTNEWDLGALAYSQDTEGPYHTDLPTPEEIHQFLQFQQLYPHLDNGIYDVVERVMRPLALRQTCRPQRDDNEDDGASHASTPSPTTYLNSLGPFNYQQYDVPTSSEQNDDLIFERQTDLRNQTQKMHKELRGGFKSFGKAL